MNKTIILINDEGDEYTVSLPARWVICGDCQGDGTTYLGWPASEQPAFTSEDFDREGPEFTNDYMSGNYDRKCPGCKGSGKTLEVLGPTMIPTHLIKDYWCWIAQLKADEEYQAAVAAERRMGA